MGLAPARSLRRAGGCSKRGAEKRQSEHLAAEAKHSSTTLVKQAVGTRRFE
jgi:hypothetical protein